MSPLPAGASGASGAFNGGAGGGAVQVITVQDPVTGQLTQQIVPCSGSMNGGVQGASTSIVTVTDPITGQPVQQVVQTIIDPTTGETSQIPISNLGAQSGAGPTQIVTVTDPVTGQPVQQLIQTIKDPITGQYIQQTVPTSSQGIIIFSTYFTIFTDISINSLQIYSKDFLASLSTIMVIYMHYRSANYHGYRPCHRTTNTTNHSEPN